jgi:hypothetical protein
MVVVVYVVVAVGIHEYTKIAVVFLFYSLFYHEKPTKPF